MSFSSDIERWRDKVNRRRRDILVGCAQLVHESIQVGSPITGAPGQPVDTGNLRGSWQLEFPDAHSALVSTKVDYAQPVEDGVGPEGPRVYGAKNGVGGSHSVKLTRAAWDNRIVPHVVQEVVSRD